MPSKKEELAAMRALAEVYPTLGLLRAANPASAHKFLLKHFTMSPNWPIIWLIDFDEDPQAKK